MKCHKQLYVRENECQIKCWNMNMCQTKCAKKMLDGKNEHVKIYVKRQCRNICQTVCLDLSPLDCQLVWITRRKCSFDPDHLKKMRVAGCRGCSPHGPGYESNAGWWPPGSQTESGFWDGDGEVVPNEKLLGSKKRFADASFGSKMWIRYQYFQPMTV